MKLLDQVRQLARVKHFSYRTEQAYVFADAQPARFWQGKFSDNGHSKSNRRG
jgi:hypothetical protein